MHREVFPCFDLMAQMGKQGYQSGSIKCAIGNPFLALPHQVSSKVVQNFQEVCYNNEAQTKEELR
jgi:hypothetical protein